MRIVTFFLALFILTPSALAGGDLGSTGFEDGGPFVSSWDDIDPLWKIQMNLPLGHPCAPRGGVWRGWCMYDFSGATTRIDVDPPKRTRISRDRKMLDACLYIDSRTHRRACYRERSLHLRGGPLY